MRLLREWMANPWYAHFVGPGREARATALTTEILNYPLENVGKVLTREQLLGEIRGVNWVHEQVVGEFGRLQELTKSDPPI